MEYKKDLKRIRRLGMLAEIASMYYEQELTQAEIAEKFCISRTRISRLLKMAKEEGIVNIQINYVGERSYELEDMLKRKFRLKDVYVLNNNSSDYDNILCQMGEFAARYMEKHMKNDQVIGISWGRSIAYAIEALKDNSDLSLDVVQIFGGMMVGNPLIEGSELARKMISKYNAKGFYLNAPLYIDNKLARETLKKQPIIENTLNKARNADMIVSGIGDVAKDTLSYMWSGFDNHRELESLVEQGAAGFICAQAYDINGNEVDSDFNQKIIGISLQELKKVKTVIGISGGKRKAAAVLGALRGNYINVLVTDRSCAKEVLMLEGKS